MTELRSAFIDRMRIKGFSERTIDSYVGIVKGITRHFKVSPLTLEAQHILE